MNFCFERLGFKDQNTQKFYSIRRCQRRFSGFMIVNCSVAFASSDPGLWRHEPRVGGK